MFSLLLIFQMKLPAAEQRGISKKLFAIIRPKGWGIKLFKTLYTERLKTD